MSVDIILNSPVVKALGLSLFHSMWQAVVVFCLIQILLFWVRQPAHKYRIQYGGLCIIFIAFVVTFLDQMSMPHATMEVLTQAQVADNTSGAHSPLQQASLPWWQSLVSMHRSPVFLRALPFITIGYGLGILLLSFRTILSFNRVFTLRKKMLPAPASLHHEIFHLKNILRIKKQVGIYLSQTINVPIMLGYLKPIIVLPVALVNQLDKQQVEAILLHELAHIRRHDYLFNMLQIIMETLLFFNPIVWWLSGVIRKERELACDDHALKFIGTPLKYAQALFALEEARVHNLSVAMSATGNNSEKHFLFNRIKRMTDMKNNNRKSPQGVAVALTALMITVAMVGFFVADAQDLTKDTKEQETKTSNYRKSTVIVKDENGQVHKYEDESSSDEDASQAFADAMKEAQSALSQIDEDQIEDFTKAAKALHTERIEEMMSEARQELANVDWSEVSKSIEEGLGAVKDIDWNEIGTKIDKELKSIKDIGLDNEEVRRAMKEARSAIEEAKKASSKAMSDSKEAAKHLSAAKIQRDYALLATAAGMQSQRKIEGDYHDAADEHLSALKEHKRLSKEHEASAINSAQSGLNDMNQFLAELKARNLVDDVENVKVKMTNEVLYLNGKKQSQTTFDAMKKYAPKGDKYEISISHSSK